MASWRQPEGSRSPGRDPPTARSPRWVSRGDRVAGSWSRYATFAEAVHLAEDAHDPPLLVALTNKFNSMDATEAWKFLQQNEPGFARRPDPEPVKVTVTFGPTVEGDSA